MTDTFTRTNKFLKDIQRNNNSGIPSVSISRDGNHRLQVQKRLKINYGVYLVKLDKKWFVDSKTSRRLQIANPPPNASPLSRLTTLSENKILDPVPIVGDRTFVNGHVQSFPFPLIDKCPPGKRLNIVTNRCRKNSMSNTSYQYVKAGQSHSNRSGQRAKSPCPPGKSRNIVTKRCRKDGMSMTSPHYVKSRTKDNAEQMIDEFFAGAQRRRSSSARRSVARTRDSAEQMIDDFFAGAQRRRSSSARRSAELDERANRIEDEMIALARQR